MIHYHNIDIIYDHIDDLCVGVTKDDKVPIKKIVFNIREIINTLEVVNIS